MLSIHCIEEVAFRSGTPLSYGAQMEKPKEDPWASKKSNDN
jgi:hypothetical protein